MLLNNGVCMSTVFTCDQSEYSITKRGDDADSRGDEGASPAKEEKLGSSAEEEEQGSSADEEKEEEEFSCSPEEKEEEEVSCSADERREEWAEAATTDGVVAGNSLELSAIIRPHLYNKSLCHIR